GRVGYRRFKVRVPVSKDAGTLFIMAYYYIITQTRARIRAVYTNTNPTNTNTSTKTNYNSITPYIKHKTTSG
ncbi:MAG: hypothetical protein ACK5KT_15805, partial [Dysgonomonas sp.]